MAGPKLPLALACDVFLPVSGVAEGTAAVAVVVVVVLAGQVC